MKMTIVLGINLTIGILFIGLASYIKAQRQTPIKITAIRSSKGRLLLNIFKDQASYAEEQPYKQLQFDKKNLADGTLIVKCELNPAVYGFTIVDDENGNGKIDKNLIGMPKEGFGFSNFFMQQMKKPVFDDFKVDLTSQRPIEIQVKYL